MWHKSLHLLLKFIKKKSFQTICILGEKFGFGFFCGLVNSFFFSKKSNQCFFNLK